MRSLDKRDMKMPSRQPTFHVPWALLQMTIVVFVLLFFLIGCGKAQPAAQPEDTTTFSAEIKVVENLVLNRHESDQFDREVTGNPVIQPRTSMTTDKTGSVDMIITVNAPGEVPVKPTCSLSAGTRVKVLPDGYSGNTLIDVAVGKVICENSSRFFNSVVFLGGNEIIFEGTAFKLVVGPNAYI